MLNTSVMVDCLASSSKVGFFSLIRHYEQTENTIDELRASGELDRIIGEMRLGLGE